MDKIEALLQSDPLPDDAEEQLERLLAELPEDERAAVEAGYHEALAVALAAADAPDYESDEIPPLLLEDE